jgi:hypothetical protein
MPVVSVDKIVILRALVLVHLQGFSSLLIGRRGFMGNGGCPNCLEHVIFLEIAGICLPN